MKEKILIVEDQWIEANDLQTILEQEGFEVTGIAKSVEQSLVLLEATRPDMVLLDIFLKGDLTGIDLAKTLAVQGIPFIYLTANSDMQTLEAAKATQPYGFLVKPYREKDILVALEIAGYRYKSQRELISRQEKWLSNTLNTIQNSGDEHEDKLFQLVKAFNPFLSFCYVLVDLNIKRESMAGTWLLEGSGYEDFKPMHGYDILEAVSSNWKQFYNFRKASADFGTVVTNNFTTAIPFWTTEPFPVKLAEYGKIRSSLYIPLTAADGHTSGIYFFSTGADRYNNDHIELVNSVRGILGELAADLARQEEKQLPTGRTGAVHARGIAQQEISGIIGKSSKLLDVLSLVRQVAPVDTTVLISGETGVGKEGLASAIHQLSDRHAKPFIKINCAAIPPALIESELFGHEKGSYTGASDRRIGKFEQAQGGTIFLDEVGEIPLDIQSKLLRVLQEKELERIGGRQTIKIDVRIIAATNRNLYAEVGGGRFRIDLYYRLNVFPILVPPLRERKEDIPLLAAHFLQHTAESTGGKIKKLAASALDQLLQYNWPGNIRELQNLIEREVLISDVGPISRFELPEEELVVEKPQKLTAEDKEAHEREQIEAALKKANGKISGTGGAAELLGLTPSVLSSRMRKLGIVWKYNFQ